MTPPNKVRGGSTSLTSALFIALISFPAFSAQTPPSAIEIARSPVAIQILVQSPAETTTDLQVICLFQSSPVNTLHGSLLEMNEKLGGLLDRVRKPELFRGELGETLLIVPPKGSLTANKLLIIGLGDSQSFSPPRMQLVGEIVYNESSRFGVAHPFFAPTILDGGVSKFATGEVAEQLIAGFLRAAATGKFLSDASASPSQPVTALTFLAGAKNVANTRQGIEKALAQK
jgi:hypothetical protein